MAETESHDPDEVLEEILSDDLDEHVATSAEATGHLRVLQNIRIGIEAVTTWSGNLSWRLAWIVFILGLFNVITRYLARFIERDIIVGEIFDLQWMLFGVLFLLAFNYGMREGVNPRIDFWWANYPAKRKARIDFVFHLFLLLPFTWLGIRILYPWAMTGLGRRFDGTWPTWKVWEIWEQSGDAGGLPRGPIKFVVFAGFVLFATQIIAEMIKTYFVMRGREDLANLAERESPLRVE